MPGPAFSTNFFPEQLHSLLAELYEKSRAAEFGCDPGRFHALLHEIRLKHLPNPANASEISDFLTALRIEDLVLARACADGHGRAWETFMARYREKLYASAAYITKEASAARDLADSLYAELYGTSLRDGARVSKLSSYTGRGSLEGWLRTVLAQEHINRYRKGKRLVSLDEESESGVQYAAATPAESTIVDPRVEAATDAALAALPPEDRFILASYFLDGRTLAEIARTLKVHESTISRKVDKLSKSLRKSILAGLRDRGMSRRQAEESLEIDVRDLNVNLRKSLQETESSSFSRQEGESAKSTVRR
jgi:RNA polymerase sigma-70 factor (ECF subfamily)